MACLVSRDSELAYLLRSLIKLSPPPPSECVTLHFILAARHHRRTCRRPLTNHHVHPTASPSPSPSLASLHRTDIHSRARRADMPLPERGSVELFSKALLSFTVLLLPHLPIDPKRPVASARGVCKALAAAQPLPAKLRTWTAPGIEVSPRSHHSNVSTCPSPPRQARGVYLTNTLRARDLPNTSAPPSPPLFPPPPPPPTFAFAIAPSSR